MYFSIIDFRVKVEPKVEVAYECPWLGHTSDYREVARDDIFSRLDLTVS